MDNTLINYDSAARNWAQLHHLKSINTVDDLKEYYRTKGNYSDDWLTVQEWLYTEGLSYAILCDGASDLIQRLRDLYFEIVIVSHKTYQSARNNFDLHSPARNWIQRELSESGIDLQNKVFLENSRDEKIARIRRERLTYFVDDLVDVLLDSDFPREVKAFWLTKNVDRINLESVTPISNLKEIIEHVHVH